MPYKLNPQQKASVLALSGPERYAHFISRIADWQEIWSLKNDAGFVSMSDSDGNNGIPFWPHPDYAQLHAVDDWSDCKPALIQLDDFMENWLHNLEEDKTKAVIFPTPEMKGIVVTGAELRQHLETEREKY